jgi:peptide-methionine (S)-S-oxide reductase
LAEEYHQKYWLQQQPEIMDEIRTRYRDGGWIDSTAAARANAYLGGQGSPQSLPAGISSLGLSPEASEKLLRIALRLQR